MRLTLGSKIGIVGAGLIGRAWAIVFARGGALVAMFDPDPKAMAAAPGAIRAGLEAVAGEGLLEEMPAAVFARVDLANSLAQAVAEADYVQENTVETLEAKRHIFAELDRLAAAQTILASSTSNIPGSLFTEALAGRARCLVAHPVNPPHLVPLVELVPTRFSDPRVVSHAKELLEGVGQVPIVVDREIEGFILNRLQAALLNEAFRLVEDGYVSTEDIDKTIKEGLGLRWSFMGPFETIDLNAPGGVRDYVRRYAASIHRLAQQQADPRVWKDSLVDRIEAERRRVLPADKLAERAEWRDRRLAALIAHKRAQDKKYR